MTSSIQPRRFPFVPSAFFAALVASLAACHNSGGGGSSNLGTADVLIHDAAIHDLLSFSAEIRSVRLRRGDGAFTSDLLRTGEVRVEFLGLDDASALLVHSRIPVEEYDAVEIGFTPGSYLARAESGLDVTVTATEDTFLARLPVLLTVVKDDYVRLDVDLNLGASLSGSVAGGSVEFAPEGSATLDDGLTALSLRDTKARVTAIDELAGLLTVESFADDAQAVSLGERIVRTGTTQLFLDVDGSALGSAPFYAALLPGQTLLEVHGTLGPDGEIQASRIDIEDHSSGAGSLDTVCIEGVVVGLGASAFELRVNDVEDGDALALPIIAALPNGSVLDVSFDAGTVFVLGKTLVSDSSALSVGRRVEVRFCSFATSPFAACVVDVDDQEPALEGTVTDASGAPLSFRMRLEPQDPAVMAGLVQSDLTDVEVTLGASQIRFDGAGDPVLLPADLVAGLELETRGVLTGTALLPTLAASEVRVSGGQLSGASVASVDEANARFTTSAGTLTDPFGPSVTPGTQLIRIQPAAVFTGAASSSAEFFTLLAGSQGASTLVSVRGLGTLVANEIRAFEIHAKLP